MIQLNMTGINSDGDVAKIVERLENIGSLNEIMVTLGSDSSATIIVTGDADDSELRDAISKAGSYSLVNIERQGIDPYNQDR
ncbi:hypothetical protein [Flaviflexus huanghaiensis]|uniref:hypothetical protein n=1 Tax=Flaviflexus huanghaiensis TaxID=1111473 RepID=UPI0015FC9818|nr:hypothetical protein [Flaviflexus huanghaiensis]